MLNQLLTLALVAQDAAPAGGSVAGGGSHSFIMIAVIVGIFYFMMIRPQQKQLKQHREFLDGLQPGVRVVTNGGILGSVARVEETVITIEIADKVRIKVLRTQVQGLAPDTRPKDPGQSKKKAG